MDQDSALPLMELILVVFLWMSAWTWWRYAKRADDHAQAAAYSTAAVFGFAGLVIVYLFLVAPW